MEQLNTPATRVRALREAHQDPLTQEQLAMIAGLSRRHLQDLESSPFLAKSVEALLRITIALQVNFHDLVDPTLFRRLAHEVAGRRSVAFGY